MATCHMVPSALNNSCQHKLAPQKMWNTRPPSFGYMISVTNEWNRFISYKQKKSYRSPHFFRSCAFGGPCVQHLSGFCAHRDPATGDVAAVLLSFHAFERLIRWRREMFPTPLRRFHHHLPLPPLRVLGAVCQSLQSALVERLRKIV